MVNEEFVVSLSTHEEILQNTNGLLAHHRSQNVGRARVSEFKVEHQSENLAIVRVRWRIYDREEVLLWDWLNTYNLVNHGSGWKIAVSTTHPVTDSASAP
jgi:hypothetical protein